MHLHSPFAVAAVLLACAAAARGGDLYQKKDGTFNPPLKGGGSAPVAADYEASNIQILDADSTSVTTQVTLKDKTYPPQKVPSIDVARIFLEPKDIPSLLKEAMDIETGGDHKKSAERFRAIGDEKRYHPVIRQDALLYAARAVAASGKVAEADQAYEALLRAFPQSFHTLLVWKDRSQMWMDAGDMEKAKGAAQKIVENPGASDGDRLEAKFLLVTINFRVAAAAKDQGGIQKALNEYKAIAQETAGKKDLASVNALARVGQGNCLLELGTVGEAKALFLDICERATDKAVCAAGFNGLGECWYRETNFVEARRCFLRTVVVYAEGAPADQIAKALYYAGDCFGRLLDSDDAKDRARRELNECKRRFPTSDWAKKAERALQGLPR